jgi:hypothetical protein
MKLMIVLKRFLKKILIISKNILECCGMNFLIYQSIREQNLMKIEMIYDISLKRTR